MLIVIALGVRHGIGAAWAAGGFKKGRGLVGERHGIGLVQAGVGFLRGREAQSLRPTFVGGLIFVLAAFDIAYVSEKAKLNIGKAKGFRVLMNSPIHNVESFLVPLYATSSKR